MTIHLLISRGKASAAGGANEGPGRITLEILETEDLGRGVELFLHEVGHLMEKVRFDPLFEAASRRHGLKRLKGNQGWDAHQLVREALMGALVPAGALSPYLGRQPMDHTAAAVKARERGDQWYAGLLELTGLYFPLVSEYIEQGRPIDKDLLDRALAYRLKI